MQAHLQAVSILYRAVGIIWLLVAALASVFVLFLGALMSWLAGQGGAEMPPEGLFVFVAALVIGIGLLFGLAHFIAGLGFRGGRSWARIMAIILGIFDLFCSVPFGTAVGIYVLWVCLSSKTQHLFEHPAQTQG
jgi:hypothetical protein